MDDKRYGAMSLDELFTTSRSYVAGDFRFAEVRAEIDRRVSKAQINAAWVQVAIAVAMYLTLLATVAGPWIARLAR